MIKNISKILTKGSAKQRVILLANEIGERGYSGKSNLTDKELDELMDSFKSPDENKIYEKFRRQEELIRNVIGALGQIQNAFLERKSSLDGYIYLKFAYGDVEDILNSLLDTVREDPHYTKRLEKKLLKVLKNRNLMFSTIEVEDNNNILINSGGEERGLDIMIETITNQAIDILIQYKTMLKAVRDSIKETGFKVEAYIKHIDNSEDLIKGRLKNKTLKISNIDLKYDEVNIDENLYKSYREQLI